MDKDELLQFVGGKIKEFRKTKKMSQQDLADKIGVSNSSISEYERGRVNFDADTLFKLADIFEVKLDDFFPQKENDTSSLEMAKQFRSENINLDDMFFFREIYENAISMSDEERKKFLESLKFFMNFHEKMYGKD